MSAPDLRLARRRGRCRNRLSFTETILLPSVLLFLLCLPRGASAGWFSSADSPPPAEERSRPTDSDSRDSGSDSAESSLGSSSSSWKHKPVSEEDGMGGEEEEAGVSKGRDSGRGRDEDSPSSPSSTSSSSRSSSHSSWEEEGSIGDDEGPPSSSGTKSRTHSSWDEEGSSGEEGSSSSSSLDSPSGSLHHGTSSSDRDSDSSTSSRHRGRTPPGPEEDDSSFTSRTGSSSLGKNGEPPVCPGFPSHTVAAVYLSNLAITCLATLALLTGLDSIPNCTPLRYRRTAVLFLGALAGTFVLIHLATPLGFFDGLIPTFGLLAVVCLLGTAPVILFSEFREVLLHTTHPWLLSPHALRVLHFLFLPLFDVGLLPLAFAGPAGWGGLLFGLTAPVVALALGAHPEFARGLGILWTAAGALELIGVLVLNSILIPGFMHDSSTQPGARDMGFMWHSVFLVVHYTIPVLLVLHGFSLWKLAVQGGDSPSQPTMIWQEDDAELAGIYGPDSPGAQGAGEGAFDAFMREASLKSGKGSGSGRGGKSGNVNGSGGGEKEREMVQVKEGGVHAQNGESEPLKHQEP